MEKGSNTLENGSITTLCDAIVLRSVVSCKFLLRSGILQVLNKFSTQVLATSVGMEGKDGDISVSLHLCFKLFICLKHI